MIISDHSGYLADLKASVQHYDADRSVEYKTSILSDMLGDNCTYRDGTSRHAADLLLADHILQRGYRALDVGCGGGVYFHFLQNAGFITGIDPSQPMLDLAREISTSDLWAARCPVELLCTDLFHYQSPDQSYDLVYSIGVIGHWIALNMPIMQKLIDLTAENGVIVLLLDRTSIWDWRYLVRKILQSRFNWARRHYAGSMHPVTRFQINRLIISANDQIDLLSMRTYQFRGTHYIALLLKKQNTVIE